MDEEKSFIVIIDDVPSYNMVLTKYATIYEIKQYLSRYSKYNITLFVNPETKVDVFETTKYDDVSLKSLWEEVRYAEIRIDTKRIKEEKTHQEENNIKTYIFKLEDPKTTFRVGNKYGGEVLVDVNWEAENKSIELIKQVKINLMLQRQLENGCKRDPTKIDVVTHFEEERIMDFTIDDKRMMKEVCQKYIKDSRNQSDVLSRDQDAFESVGDKDNIDLYAVVAVDFVLGYIGHVYTWLSPKDKTICFMIGIRSTPMMPFLRMIGKGIGNISKILIKGVADFAKMNGASKIVIPHPIGNMRTLLEKLGFTKTNKITPEMIGFTKHLFGATMSGICNDCYLKNI